MIKEFITSIVSPITNLISKRNDNKTTIKKQQIERLKNSDDALAEWELINAENGRYSLKDEFWTVILAVPLVLCFIPEMVPHIKAGFDAISDMPDFYQYWLGVAILSSFGVRFTRK